MIALRKMVTDSCLVRTAFLIVILLNNQFLMVQPYRVFNDGEDQDELDGHRREIPTFFLHLQRILDHPSDGRISPIVNSKENHRRFCCMSSIPGRKRMDKQASQDHSITKVQTR